MREMESRNDSVVRPGRRGMTMTTATTTTLSLGSSAMWMLLLLLWLTVWTGPCQGENTTNVTTTLAPSAVPSSLPSSHHTLAPSSPARNVTTAAPSSSWTPPSAAPSHANSSNVTNAPTALPHISPTATPTGSKPSSAPSRPPPPPPSASPTATPTAPPSSSPTSPAPPTIAPTAAPTEKYNPTPTDDHQHQHHHNDGHKGFSVWRILAKTLGWLILIALSVLLFGAIMSNRYQILYTLRMWGRAFLQWHGTQWFLEKTRLNRWIGGSSSGSGALNDVIFDRGDLSEGLLLSRNDE